MQKFSQKLSRNNAKPAIKAEKCTVRFGRVNVFENLSFSIAPGAISAIIGPNGSGKSTLMKAMLGLIDYEGSIEVLGHHPKKSYGHVGYVPQQFTMDSTVPITVGEFLDLARREHLPRTVLHEALGEVGLNPVVVSRASMHTLSGGQRQRVLIARAILHRPEILFLDEPASGVDIHGEQTFFEILHHLNKEHSTTIVLISHEIDLVAKHVNHVLCLNHGLVCSGPPAKALTKERIEETFGSNYEMHDHPHV
jgi:zinc transport system ATP-binding protein